MSFRLRQGIAVIALAGCTACGLKGPLYLPDRASNVEVHPVPAAASPAAAGEQQPADEDTSSDEERRESDRSDSAKRNGV